jgi:hypothetical protein
LANHGNRIPAVIKVSAIGAIVSQIAGEFEVFFEFMFATCCFKAHVAYSIPGWSGWVKLLPVKQRIPLKS